MRMNYKANDTAFVVIANLPKDIARNLEMFCKKRGGRNKSDIK